MKRSGYTTSDVNVLARTRRTSRAVTVISVLVLVGMVGCTRRNKKGGEGDAGAQAAAGEPVGAPPVAPAPLAANEDDVARFLDETPLGNVAATLQRSTTNVREIPRVGKVVTTLAKGAAVTEIAQRGSAFLVVFDKDQKKLMGWVGQDSFTATAVDPSSKAGKVLTCSAPDVPLMGDGPFCGRVCASDADCADGHACKGSANSFAKGKVGGAVSLCAFFSRVVRPVAPAAPVAPSGGRAALTATPSASPSAPGAPAPAADLPPCGNAPPPNPKPRRPGEAPAPPPPQAPCIKLPSSDRANGMPCERRSQCRSQKCSTGGGAGTCSTCRLDADCGTDFACTSDPRHRATVAAAHFTESICVFVGEPEEPSENRASSSPSRSSKPDESRAKPKGTERGRMCGKDSECQSGTCKMENRTRGRCL